MEYEESLHALEAVLRSIPSTLSLQEVVLECVSALNLDKRLSRPLQLEELMLRLASQSRLRCFTIEFPDQASLERWKRTLQRQFPQLHAEGILEFRCTGEPNWKDDGGRARLIS